MIPFESPAIVGVSSRSDTVGSAGDFSGTRRKRHGCRPNRTPASASGLDAGLPFARRQRRRAESREEFFGPDGTGDAPVHLAGPMRKRKPEVLFTSRSPVGGIHRADRRVLRSKMATVVCPKKLGASCSPRRSDGQRVCQALPSPKIRDKGAVAVGRDSKWRISRID